MYTELPQIMNNAEDLLFISLGILALGEVKKEARLSAQAAPASPSLSAPFSSALDPLLPHNILAGRMGGEKKKRIPLLKRVKITDLIQSHHKSRERKGVPSRFTNEGAELELDTHGGPQSHPSAVGQALTCEPGTPGGRDSARFICSYRPQKRA